MNSAVEVRVSPNEPGQGVRENLTYSVFRPKDWFLAWSGIVGALVTTPAFTGFLLILGCCLAYSLNPVASTALHSDTARLFVSTKLLDDFAAFDSLGPTH